MDIIIERISDLLSEKKISQKQFMADLKLSTATFSEWKAGRVKSYKKYIEEIADYLGVSVDYLLGRTDNPIPNHKDNMTFADRLNQILSEQGITAYKISKDTKISNSILSDWRLGKRIPSGEKIEVLATYLNVSVDYLLGLSDDPTPKATGAAIGYGSKEYVIRGLSKEEFDELQNYLEYQRSKAKK